MQPKNILLLEPGYRNKYPPLGLMKLAQYHREQSNGRDNVVFAKGEDDPKLHDFQWDRIYITTLFSFEWRKTERCIDKAVELVWGQTNRIFVGGIAASLMTDQFRSVNRWGGIRFIEGLLNAAPAKSLRLKSNEFGGKDLTSVSIEDRLPDYSILKQIEYAYPVHDAYFGYASRGCIRKCAFCGVPKLEGDQKIMPPISQFVNGIIDRYGEKKDLILMDNNVTAAPNFNDIMAEIRDLGFIPNAKLKRNERYLKRRVDFNQGVDSRLLSKNPALLREMATICIDPLRIAFDHLGVKKPYERSIRGAAEHGITSLSNYMLYNFYDTPEDLYRRLELNISLNSELGIRIWSFPMRYQPVDLKDRSFVGKNWNRYFLRSFQVMLQATHGVVTGNPSFFGTAFGSSLDEFQSLLLLPHEFIFNRTYYFKGAGRGILDDYNSALKKLSESQRLELVDCLTEAYQVGTIRTKDRLMSLDRRLQDSTVDNSLKRVIRFYIHHFNAKAVVVETLSTPDTSVPEEKKIEDAGLFEDTSVSQLSVA